MSSDNGQPPEVAQEQQDPKKLPVMTITITENGVINVNGPGNGKVYDEMVCLFMLEKAKDAIKLHNARAMQSAVQVPKGNMVNFARRFMQK